MCVVVEMATVRKCPALPVSWKCKGVPANTNFSNLPPWKDAKSWREREERSLGVLLVLFIGGRFSQLPATFAAMLLLLFSA